jgi:hypothetical protein
LPDARLRKNSTETKCRPRQIHVRVAG